MSLLDVNKLNTYFADSHILFDVSLTIDRNEVVALLGRNGAGKTTTLKSLMGVVTPSTGSSSSTAPRSLERKAMPSPRPACGSFLKIDAFSVVSMSRRTSFYRG